MAWIYEQATGVMSFHGRRFNGYSGKDPYKNQTAAEHRMNEGPIPRGWWLMIRLYNSTNGKGDDVIELVPITAMGTNTFGRTDFRIHGDSIRAPGTASEGCIILSPASVRQEIWNSGEHFLLVR